MGKGASGPVEGPVTRGRGAEGGIGLVRKMVEREVGILKLERLLVENRDKVIASVRLPGTHSGCTIGRKKL